MGDTAERRARLVRRQLSGVGSAVDATRSVVVLHATDPATVYLSVLARCPELTVDDVAREMYDERRLVRVMAMRRTLFVAPVELVPVVHAQRVEVGGHLEPSAEPAVGGLAGDRARGRAAFLGRAAMSR